MATTHPLGTKARVLLSGVFGPYAQDDAFGSRKINPMELYQNQVTRFQGAFSLRMFHRSFGLMLIQNNIDAPCTLLDFPTQDRFIEEITHNAYDIIGISAIIPNVAKVIRMCELVRRHQPRATLVLGGHIANLEDIHDIVDANHIVKGDGVAWFRAFLGQDVHTSIRHPLSYSGYGTRVMGMTLKEKPGSTAAMLLPSAGCPVGCNFCSTSALFGGKGKFVNFYETGDELFTVMCELENRLKIKSFFVMDENFLLHRRRALRLLELMESNNKSWALYVFSSARVLRSYTAEQLIGLGISWVWMGLEGEQSQYQKLKNIDTRSLVRSLQSHGIRVLGSSIIGMEHHRPEDMSRIIDHAVGHGTDFHQFMLYTPNSGTPLYEKHKAEKTLIDPSEFPHADAHGQYRFNFRHPHIQDGEEETFLHKAFIQDFKVNGPSLARLIRTQLIGWQRHKNHLNPRVRNRFLWENQSLATSSAGAVWAMRKWYGSNSELAGRMDSLLTDLYAAFGWKSRIAAPLLGRYLWSALKKEEKRLASGWTYEPDTFYEKNTAALPFSDAKANASKPRAVSSQWVTCKTMAT
ncbi:MAG: cobalamin-dependent protein [Pseudomonadota bacterium]